MYDVTEVLIKSVVVRQICQDLILRHDHGSLKLGWVAPGIAVHALTIVGTCLKLGGLAKN